MLRNCIRLSCATCLSVMLVATTRAAAPDPIVYYSFDELDATVVDESGNGYDGTPQGAIALSADGFSGSSYQFDGSDTRIELQRPIQDSFTLTGWLKAATPGLDGTMAFHGSGLFWSDVGGSANDFVVAVLGSKLSFNVGNPNTTVTSGGNIVTVEWVHVAAVRDVAASAISVYINGTLDTRINHTNGESLTRNPLVVIGGNPLDNRYYTGLIDEVKFFDTALSERDIQGAMAGADTTQAGLPSPEDGASAASRDVTLSWSPGEFAVSHDVYIGDSFDDVNTATVPTAAGLDVSSFDPGRLEFDQTYSWRVDEVNAAPDFTVFQGNVWSFTTEPFSLPILGVTATASSTFGESGPEKTIDGSGMADDLHGTSAGDMWISGGVPATIEYSFDRANKLHELWIWNSNQLIEVFVGFGAKDVVIEHSLDGENWTVLDGVGPLAPATGRAGDAHSNTIDFGGATAQHVRVTINSNQGIAPQTSLSEVRFFYIPTYATRPDPEAGATAVAPDVTLSWGRNGREAGRHDVYVGTDAANLSLAGSVSESSLDTSALDLQLGQTYSWRVDEVNEAMDPGTWMGDVWSFTTVDAISVDDMESYKDAEFLEIWATWVDGFDDPANGSVVGGASGTPETGIVHGGSQSLPMDYDNRSASASEATRTFDAPMNWTGHGLTTLSLFVYKGDDSTGGDLYLKINDTKVPLVDNSTYMAGYNPGWVQYHVDLASLDVSNVSSLTIGVEGPGAQGVIFVDDIRLYAAAPALNTLVSAVGALIEAESGATTDPFEVLSDRPEASGGSYIYTDESVGNSNDDPPAPDSGWAVYTINIPADGNYLIAFRGAQLDSDSFWVNIPGMVVNDLDLDDSGFVRSNGLFSGKDFVWDFVRDDAGDTTTDPIIFTLTAGQHELQITRREDGTALDAIAIFSVN